ETASVFSPKNIVLRENTNSALEGLHDRTFLERIRFAINSSVGDERVHLLALQFGGPLVAEQAKAGGVAEGASAFQVHAKYSFGCGIEQQAKLFLAPPQLFFGALALD